MDVTPGREPRSLRVLSLGSTQGERKASTPPRESLANLSDGEPWSAPDLGVGDPDLYIVRRWRLRCKVGFASQLVSKEKRLPGETDGGLGGRGHGHGSGYGYLTVVDWPLARCCWWFWFMVMAMVVEEWSLDKTKTDKTQTGAG